MQQNRQQKTVLFFSKFCGHSTEALRAITGRDLRSAFALLCIDDAEVRRRLPAYVDRVPLAFTPDRRILADDALLSYIHGGGGPAEGMAGAPVSEDPIAAGLGGNTGFSWLEDDDDVSRAATGGGGAYRDRGAAGSLFLTLHHGDGGDPAWHGQHIDPPPDDEQRDPKKNQMYQQSQPPPYHQQGQQQHSYDGPHRGMQQGPQPSHPSQPSQPSSQPSQPSHPQGRMMPVATFGASSSVASLESLEAIREQERQSWSPSVRE